MRFIPFPVNIIYSGSCANLHPPCFTFIPILTLREVTRFKLMIFIHFLIPDPIGISAYKNLPNFHRNRMNGKGNNQL